MKRGFFSRASTKNVKHIGNDVLHWFEISLGVLVLLAVLVFTILQVMHFVSIPLTEVDVFLEILKIILQLAIGIEVARMLFSYSLSTIVELAVFIVARKMLLIEEDFIALILSVVALGILFATRHFFIEDDAKQKTDKSKKTANTA